MNALWTALGLVVLLLALSDVIETIVLPRTVQRGLRLTPLLLRSSWTAMRPLLRALPPSGLRQTLLVAFAPLTLIFLLLLWATMLIFGFALIQYGHHTPWISPTPMDFSGHLYVSGVNFFTLGLGDVFTTDRFGRFLSVTEAGVGFGFLGLVVGYVPVFYNAFSRREVQMVLLDSKAGSVPSAAELLHRHAEAGVFEPMVILLKEFERWSAELLESYLSYPILAFYRSQHDDQSWLITLTAMLDACALIEVGFENAGEWRRPLQFQSRATYAMARHVIVDLAYLLNVAPDRTAPNRLPKDRYEAMRQELHRSGLELTADPERLREIRETYEPYVVAMADRLLLNLPPWHTPTHAPDNWQTSAWDGVRHL